MDEYLNPLEVFIAHGYVISIKRILQDLQTGQRRRKGFYLVIYELLTTLQGMKIKDRVLIGYKTPKKAKV